ncbi:MAG: hypothetical protein ABIG95_02240 [Candidatus Woesearchaeota archaeon]
MVRLRRGRCQRICIVVKMKKSLSWVVFARLSGLLFFLIVLAVADIFVIDGFAAAFVAFLKRNILLIFFYSAVFLVADIFMVAGFPVNLISPVINAVGAMLVLTFVFRLLNFLGLSAGINFPFWLFYIVVYPVVFFAVLIGGYVKMLWVGGERVRRSRKKSSVGEEFRQLMYDMLTNLRKVFEPK